MTNLWQTIVRPPFADDGSRANLEDLRQQLAARLAFVLVVTGGLIAWAILPVQPLNTTVFALSLALVGVGLLAWRLNTGRPRLARHILVWGATALLVIAIWTIDSPWLPFLGLLVTFANAFLVWSSGWLAASAAGLLTVWLSSTEPSRAYAVPTILITLLIGVSLSWLVINTLYTALQWARTMQRRADELLEEAQNNQAELKRTLKSLELATYLVERSNQELEIARAHTEEARRMKEQFAANISHELRTPLNLILGFSEMMYISPEVYGDMHWPATLRRDVYQIHRSSVHLLEMIDDILDLSRFEIAGFTLNKELLNIEGLLRNAAEIAAGLLRGRPVEFSLSVEPGLPALEIDPTRIRQVVLNLISNAQRFTPRGAIRLSAVRAGDEVIISVSDTGAGIPADKLPRVFEEFYQVDGSLRRSHEGAGLGLAICRRFAEAHDGRIWADSEAGKGSTFHVALPIPGARPPIARPHLAKPLRPPALRSLPRVLVVDPDPAVATLISRHVSGYDIVPVADEGNLSDVALQNAKVVIRNVPPDGINGAVNSATRATRRSITGAPVVECSLPSQSWIASDLSVTACLTKPVTTQQLMREIGKLDKVRDVLIVDDDPGFGELVERVLAASGATLEVRRAYDGQQALRAMAERRPDLVLTDLAMPVMDGFEMLARMRQTPELAGVPVILLTVTSYAEDALRYHAGRMTVCRDGGLQPFEVLGCLQSLLGALCVQSVARSDNAKPAQRVENAVAPNRF